MSPSVEGPPVITCKAAVAWAPGEPLVLEEVQVDTPKAMEIRIRVVCTSLCRSDVTQWESKAQPDLFPRIFGHEASGIVESVGEGVTEFVVGDHVLTLFIGECTRCKHCHSGRSNMCQVLGLERNGVMHSDQRTRFSIKGRPVYHYCAVSSFSEYTVIHSGCAVKISASAPMDKICLLSCGAAAGLGAAWKVADISEGSTVVIFGLGSVGLSVAQGAKLRGAHKIIGIDTDSEKCEKGKSFGITDFINPNDHDEPIQQAIHPQVSWVLFPWWYDLCLFRERMDRQFSHAVRECSRAVDALANYACSYQSSDKFFDTFSLPSIVRGEITMDSSG